MSSYNPYSNRYSQPPRPSPWPLALLVVLGAVLGFLLLSKGLGWRLWPQKNPELSAEPRPIEPRGDLAGDEKDTIKLYKQLAPSVVHVGNIAARRDMFNLRLEQEVTGTGTGFIWDDKGIIVTNAHVVEGADAVQVILGDKERSSYESRFWVTYPDKDLAVLYINAPKDKLQKIPWIGTSADLQVGQKTYAIGNPFGLDQTLTTGIVSALDREIKSASGRAIQGVIQTSAAINPGNSGGPLLDSAGRLIGVNTAILSPSGAFAGIGFSIPVDEVQRVVPKLVEKLNDAIQKNKNHEEISPPRMGVILAPEKIARELGVTQGVLILEVSPGTPADKAGLRPSRQNFRTGKPQLGDVILAIEGEKVNSQNEVISVLEKHKPGETVTLKILRDGEELDVKITLASIR
jgi:S1-C subfamily serine protease